MMKYSDTFLQALEQEYDSSFDEYMSSIESKPEHTFSEKHEKKMKKLIKQQRKPYFKFVCTASRRAACIIVAVMVFSASALSVNAVREKVKSFFVGDCGSKGFCVVEPADCSSEDCPETIEKEYCISDLPDGFELIDTHKSIISVNLTYKKGTDYIFFSQSIKQNYTINLDNEHTTLEKFKDSDGTEYLVATSTYGQVMYLWDSGEYIFELDSTLDKDEVLKMCRSLKIKK